MYAVHSNSSNCNGRTENMENISRKRQHKACFICPWIANNNDNIIYHNFPNNDIMKEKWMRACKINYINKCSTICSRHFNDSDYCNKSGKLRRLKKGSIPSKCLIPSVLMNNGVFSNGISECINECNISAPSIISTGTTSSIEKEVCSNVPIILASSNEIEMRSATLTSHGQHKTLLWRSSGDIDSSHLTNTATAKVAVDLLKRELLEAKKRIILLQQYKRRTKQRYKNLHQLIVLLKQKLLLSDNLHKYVLDILPPVLKQIALRNVAGKTTKFEDEIRTFALTLHFYSPQAYDFVRREWNNLLPASSTLRKWICSYDCQPGFTAEVFQFLKMKASISSDPIICNLVIDEMSIRQQLLMKGSKLYGPVNLGFNRNYPNIYEEIDTDDDALPPLAKNVLVFLLVALNSNWKVPCAYFLINSLSGTERGHLLNKVLTMLHEHNIIVPSITFDGSSVNFTMVESLGACFTLEKNFKPYFTHPSTKETIYIFPDPPHMLKNVRNIFAKYLLYNGNDKTISWKYLTDLVDVQQDEGLQAANKLTIRHIKFNENIMNVRLAAQTLSQSTSAALHYMSQKYDHFKDAEATAEFCKQFNDAFDILNCRSLSDYKRPFQSPINEKNVAHLKSRATEIIKYIKTLTIFEQQNITQTKQKRGFVGFVISLTNIFNLYESLTKLKMNYLLTYKLCQDHLENFFSCIRLKGGFNNNPNAWQFRLAYRRLILHHQIQASKYSNCSSDNTPILFIPSCGISENITNLENDNIAVEIGEEKFNFGAENLPSEFISDIIDYIGGFIIKKLLKDDRIRQCEKCIEAVQNNTRSSALIDCKSKGFLKTPSLSLFNYLLRFEQIIRNNNNLIWHKDFVVDTIKQVSSEMPNIFQGDHDSEHANIIKEVGGALFLKIRLHHESEIISQVDRCIRRIYTNLIQFKGQ